MCSCLQERGRHKSPFLNHSSFFLPQNPLLLGDIGHHLPPISLSHWSLALPWEALILVKPDHQTMVFLLCRPQHLIPDRQNHASFPCKFTLTIPSGHFPPPSSPGLSSYCLSSSQEGLRNHLTFPCLFLPSGPSLFPTLSLGYFGIGCLILLSPISCSCLQLTFQSSQPCIPMVTETLSPCHLRSLWQSQRWPLDHHLTVRSPAGPGSSLSLPLSLSPEDVLLYQPQGMVSPLFCLCFFPKWSHPVLSVLMISKSLSLVEAPPASF